MYEYNCKICGKHQGPLHFVRQTENRFIDVCARCRQKIKQKDLNLVRLCPKCNEKIHYGRKQDFTWAQQQNTSCKKCCISVGKFVKGQETLNKESHKVCWEKKYDAETVQKKILQEKQLHSKNATGAKNNMYGKPAPIGSGNGWSGWYKGWYFRSLLELSFMINVIERFKMSWQNAETKKHQIPYVDIAGKQRNYFADFIIADKYIIECKPRQLITLDINLKKQEAAKIFCNQKGLIYKIMTPKNLTDEELVKLYVNKGITFIKRYDKRFRKKYRGPLEAAYYAVKGAPLTCER